MKVAIVGGGISGLYLADKLLMKGYNVDLYEKQNRLGGRIQSVYTKDGSIYELGAGRFSKKHKLLMKLLKQLQMYNKISAISSNRIYVKDGKGHNYDSIVGTNLFVKVFSFAKQYQPKQLKSMTMKELMIESIGIQATDEVISAFGYQSEFELQNAYTSLKVFKNDFNESVQYFYLQGGLAQLINVLHKKIVAMGCRIYTSTTVMDYEPLSNRLLTSNKINITYDKVVFCVTRNTLLKANNLMKHDALLCSFLEHSIMAAPLLRIFAQFPVTEDGISWFDGLPRVTTNLPIRYIIPLNPMKGLVQISYTDNDCTKHWMGLKRQELIHELLTNLKHMFPSRAIPEPLWVKKAYWDEGATYWMPNSTYYNNLKTNNYYIGGEMMSRYHGAWIEGGLESAEAIAGLFPAA